MSSQTLNAALDKFEEKMRRDTIGDNAHKALFALADKLEAIDPVKYALIIKRCRSGHYHDFATQSPTPKMDMHTDLLAVGLSDIDQQMQDGDFDS
jgi:hypothetical protein